MLLFTEIHLGAAEFDAMPPALRTEAVLLAMERGEKPAKIALAVGRKLSEIETISSQRHALRLSSVTAEVVPDVQPRPIVERRASGFPPKTAIRILSLLIEAGDKGYPASNDTLAEVLGIGRRHVSASMSRLLGEDLVFRLRPPHGTAPTVWAVTQAGKVTHSELARRFPS